MSNLIDQLCKSVRFQLNNVSQIRKYVSEDVCHHVIRSHVLSRLDYCNRLLTELSPSNTLRRLQSLQNWAARIIFRLDRRHDTMPLLTSLHWLPIKQRIVFKILLFVYKFFHDQAPEYFSDCLELYRPVRTNLRSNADPFRLTFHVARSKAGDCTCTVAAAKEWNKLPSSINAAPSVDVFKKLLKTYIFPT